MPKIYVELSSGQTTPIGKALGNIWYSNKTLRDLGPEIDGYPHNGGEHTMSIRGSADDCLVFMQLIADAYPGCAPAMQKFITHIRDNPETKSFKARKFFNDLLREQMAVRRHIVDLSSGERDMFGANVLHMYDIRKDLMAKAPNLRGYPYPEYGSIFVEGTGLELNQFFNEFSAVYDDALTSEAVADIQRALREGEPVIRAYRMLHPEKYEPVMVDSYMYGKFSQVYMVDNQFSFGHMISARDSFIGHALWEVIRIEYTPTDFTLVFINGFAMLFSYKEVGFEYTGTEAPNADQQKKLRDHIQVTADRYDEKLAWFDQMIASDPRYHKTGNA